MQTIVGLSVPGAPASSAARSAAITLSVPQGSADDVELLPFPPQAAVAAAAAIAITILKALILIAGCYHCCMPSLDVSTLSLPDALDPAILIEEEAQERHLCP